MYVLRKNVKDKKEGKRKRQEGYNKWIKKYF